MSHQMFAHVFHSHNVAIYTQYILCAITEKEELKIVVQYSDFAKPHIVIISYLWEQGIWLNVYKLVLDR